MWRLEHLLIWRRSARVVVVLAAASLTAGCFEPLYQSTPSLGGEGVQDKFAAVQILPVETRGKAKGTPDERVAVGMYNALSYSLHNGGKGGPPIYQLTVNLVVKGYASTIDPVSGRPNSSVATLVLTFRLTEIATSKTVLSDDRHIEVSYDIPGSQQRFAGQRAQRNAEDRAATLGAEAIRDRLASFFVAST